MQCHPEGRPAVSKSRKQRLRGSRRKTPRLSKNPMRESQTDRTPPTIVSHILVGQVRGGYPRQHLTSRDRDCRADQEERCQGPPERHLNQTYKRGGSGSVGVNSLREGSCNPTDLRPNAVLRRRKWKEKQG